MPNIVDQSAWWNPLLISAIFTATYIANKLLALTMHNSLKFNRAEYHLI